MPAASTPPRWARPSTTCWRASSAGAYRTRVIYNDIYFNEGVYLKLTQNPKAMEAVLERGPQDRRRVARLSQGRTVGDRSADAAVGAQPLRGPQRRHQDSRPRLLDHVDSTTHARHRPSLRHARAGVVVWSASRRANTSTAAPIDLAPTLAFLTASRCPTRWAAS